MTHTSDALQTYHTRYNNVTYQAVQAAVAADLDTEDLASEPTHTILNLLIDVALAFVGYPGMDGRQDRLAAVVLQAGLSMETVRLMATHLANFDRAASADFADRTLALLALRDHDLAGLQSQTAGLRGPSGATAYHLVSAAHALLHLTRLVLLNEPSAGYKREKLRVAERALSRAKSRLDLS